MRCAAATPDYPTIPTISITVLSDSPDAPRGHASPFHLQTRKAGEDLAYLSPPSSPQAIWYDDGNNNGDAQREGDAAQVVEELAAPPSVMDRQPNSPTTLVRSPPSPLRFSYTPESFSLPEGKKGLDEDRFDTLLRASRERRVGVQGLSLQTSGLQQPRSTSVSPVSVSAGGATVGNNARKSMDLRKEIAMKAHAAKHEERRQSFIARLLVQPSSSPETIGSPVTPPRSPALFHFTLPSPGLVSPLTAFEAFGNPSPTDDEYDGDFEESQSQVLNGRRIFFERVERVDWSKEIMSNHHSAWEPDAEAELDNVKRIPESIMRSYIPLPISAERSCASANEHQPISRAIPLTAPLALYDHHNHSQPPIPSTSIARGDGDALPIRTTAVAALGITRATNTAGAVESGGIVVVPPKRTASLRATHLALPVSQPFPRSRQREQRSPLPSLQDITARLSAIAGRTQPDSGTSTSSEAQRRGGLPIFLHSRETNEIAPAPKNTLTTINAVEVPVSLIPPPRPRSADSTPIASSHHSPSSGQTFQEERVQRGSAMMARLDMGSLQRRRRSDPLAENLHLNLKDRRPVGGGWF